MMPQREHSCAVIARATPPSRVSWTITPFFTQALLDLYEAGFELRDLELAIRLTEKQSELFEDRELGAFFSTAAGDPELVMRMKEDYDGAEPSGNSIAALNLLRLARLTGRAGFQESADRALAAFGSRIAAAPVGVPQMLAAYEFRLAPHRQVVSGGRRACGRHAALLARAPFPLPTQFRGPAAR